MSKINNNENRSMCSICTNVCCTQLPGGYSPAQVSPSEQERLLRKELAEWDYWLKYDKNDERFITWWYLRPATKPGSSTCIHHTDTGCSLSWEQRPYECQALVPKKSLTERCRSLLVNPKKVISMAWFLAGRQ